MTSSGPRSLVRGAASFRGQRLPRTAHPARSLQTLLEVALADANPDTTPCGRSAKRLSRSANTNNDSSSPPHLPPASAASNSGAVRSRSHHETVLTGRRHKAERTGINIESTSSPPPQPRPKLIELLVANLIDNALRTTPPAENRGRHHLDPGRATITVSNTGPTIRPARSTDSLSRSNGQAARRWAHRRTRPRPRHRPRHRPRPPCQDHRTPSSRRRTRHRVTSILGR